MKLTRMNQLFKELPSKQGEAILSLIEEKTNEDMKAVITEIHKLKNDMDAKFSIIDSRFEAMDSRFEAMDSKFEAMDSKFSSMDSKFTTVFWILGVLTTVLVGILLKVLN